jgi:hypothetical protein
MLTGRRDIGLEADFTEFSGNVCGAAPGVADQLSAFAQQRAGDGPIRDPARRDMAREACEEIADGRNYLVWWRIGDADLPPAAAAEIDVALGLLVAAYGRVLAAEAIVDKSRRPVRRALAEAIDETGRRWPACRCPLDARLTDEELVGLECGCTGPAYCCPRLATVRRRVF